MTATRPELGRVGPPRMPTLAEAELDAGMRVIAVRHPSVPLVELRLAFPLPSAQVRSPGAPMLMASSMLAGTGKHDRAGIATALERLGASLQVHVAGDLLVLGASCLATSLRELLGLVAELLTGAAYPEEEVAADRRRAADELVIVLSRPESVAHDAFAKRRYGRHPYGTGLPRPESIERVGAAAVRRLHRSLVDPSGADLVLVGDLHPRRAVGLVEEALGEWLEGAGTARDRTSRMLPPVPPVRPGGIDLVDRPGSVQSNLRLGGDAPDRLAPDWPALALANQILGGMFTSRLVANLRERNGYTYSPHSGVDQARAGATSLAGADVGTEVTAAALLETRYELGHLALGGVFEAELESARRYGVGSWLFRTATQGGLASTLASLVASGIGPSYLTEYPRRLARTSKAEVDEAARRYFGPAGFATVVVGDAEQVGRDLSLIDEVRTSRS